MNQADFLIYCWISSIISPCWKLEIGHDSNPTTQVCCKDGCFSPTLAVNEKKLHKIVNNNMLYPHVNRHDWHMIHHAFTSQRVQSKLIDRSFLVFPFSQTLRNFTTNWCLFALFMQKIGVPASGNLWQYHLELNTLYYSCTKEMSTDTQEI